MARLLGAEDIARPADFQVAQGNAKPAPKCEYSSMALSRLAAMGEIGRDCAAGAYRRRPGACTAHPAAKLVHLGQAEPVGVVDEDRVGVGNIQAGFDDRRAHQHIDFAQRRN